MTPRIRLIEQTCETVKAKNVTQNGIIRHLVNRLTNRDSDQRFGWLQLRQLLLRGIFRLVMTELIGDGTTDILISTRNDGRSTWDGPWSRKLSAKRLWIAMG